MKDEPVIEAWLEQRRALGQDGRDEFWEGVLHVARHEHSRNGVVVSQLVTRLHDAARRAGLQAGGSFNLGDAGNHRIPDLGYHRTRDYATYMPTAPLVVEVLSPGDETYAKFDFYAQHGVDELWVVDPLERTVKIFTLAGDRYQDTVHSQLLDLAASWVADQLEWP